jgi:hypothetical protein
MKELWTFMPAMGSLLQYVDDLLIWISTKLDLDKSVVQLFNFLGMAELWESPQNSEISKE